jgi:hypothetical protein
MMGGPGCKQKTEARAHRLSRSVSPDQRSPFAEIRMKHSKDKGAKEALEKAIDLGSCGSVTLHVSPDRKRLLIEFATEPEGFDKSGLNGFIDALEKVRKKMDR